MFIVSFGKASVLNLQKGLLASRMTVMIVLVILITVFLRTVRILLMQAAPLLIATGIRIDGFRKLYA